MMVIELSKQKLIVEKGSDEGLGYEELGWPGFGRTVRWSRDGVKVIPPKMRAMTVLKKYRISLKYKILHQV